MKGLMFLVHSFWFLVKRKNQELQTRDQKPNIYRGCYAKRLCETFEKRPILAKYKEGDNFNHRNTLSISRIEI
jgi:hypothetical protein